MAGTASTFTLKTNDGITTLVEQSVDTDESIVLDNGIIKFIDSSSVETTLYNLITNDYAGLSTTQGATTIDSGYGLDTTITLVNGGDQLGYTFYVVEQQEQDIAISLDNLTRYHNNLKVVLENLRLVAEGKCKALVISYLDTYSAIVSYLTNNPTKKVYLKSSGEDITNAFISGTGGLDQAISNPSFNTNDLSIPANIQGSPNLYFAAVKDENGDYYLYSLNNTIGADLNTGDLILVVETDVPDRWYDDTGYLYALETTKVDLTNYPTLSGNNTFTGTNTFSSGINIGNNKTLTGTGDGIVANADFIPNASGVNWLGSSGRKWNKAYINLFMNNNATYGLSLPDTTSWTANKEIATTDQTFNVINASDIVNNTLTQAQYDLITNGKPTLIKYSNPNDNIILLTCHIYSGYTHVLSFYKNSFSNIEIIQSTLSFNIQYGNESNGIGITDGRVNIRKLAQINGKNFPAYPTTNTSPQVLTIGASGGSLSWTDKEDTIVELDTGTYTSGTTMSANDLAFFQPLLDMDIENAAKYLRNKVFIRIDNSRNETQTSNYFSIRASGTGLDRNWYDFKIYFGDWGSITIDKGRLQNGNY